MRPSRLHRVYPPAASWLLVGALALTASACSGSPAASPRAPTPTNAPRIDSGHVPRTAGTTAVGPTPMTRMIAADSGPVAPGPFGTPDPVIVTAASPSRHWLVLCQAREDTDGNGVVSVSVGGAGELQGDALKTYFIDADSRETEVVQFIGSDPSGRHVAYRTERELWLVDTLSGKRSELTATGAQIIDDGQSFTPHRALSFDPRGHRVAYLRDRGARTSLVLRELNTGKERELPTGAGTVGRIAFEPDGEFVRLDVVDVDSNGNGRLQWPFPPAANKRGPCHGPIPQYNVWQFPGDQARPRLLRISTGKLVDVAGFVATVGPHIIARGESSELWLFSASGDKRKISSDKCNARILHSDAARELVLFGCAGAYGARRDLFLRTPGARKQLQVDVAAFEQDSRFDGRPDWLPLYPHNDSYLLDLDSSELLKLPPGSRTLAVFANTALVDVGGSLSFAWLDEADERKTLHLTKLERSRKPLQPLLVDPPLVAIGEDLFDLKARAWLGQLPSLPLALSKDKRGLVARTDSTPTQLALGPVYWKNATR